MTTDLTVSAQAKARQSAVPQVVGIGWRIEVVAIELSTTWVDQIAGIG